jgi:hypothetical protein
LIRLQAAQTGHQCEYLLSRHEGIVTLARVQHKERKPDAVLEEAFDYMDVMHHLVGGAFHPEFFLA